MKKIEQSDSKREYSSIWRGIRVQIQYILIYTPMLYISNFLKTGKSKGFDMISKGAEPDLSRVLNV